MNQTVLDINRMQSKLATSLTDKNREEYFRSAAFLEEYRKGWDDTCNHLDSRELADYLNCSVSTVERLTREGVIPSFKVGRLRRYAKSEVILALRGKGDAIRN